VHESWSHHQVLLQGHCCHLDASMIPHDEAMHKHHCIHALVRGTTLRRYGLCRLALAALEPARFRWCQLSARRCSCLYITFYARSGLTSMELHVVLTTRALWLSAPRLYFPSYACTMRRCRMLRHYCLLEQHAFHRMRLGIRSGLAYSIVPPCFAVCRWILINDRD
jgi:hypothetical protein